MGRASGVGARCWGTPVEFGCLLTYRQLISGCRAVRNLSPTGALFLFHDVRLYDPERRLVRGPPRKGLGMCRRVTNKGESGFGIANDRGTVAVEWKHHRCDRLKRPRDLSIEVSVLRGWDPKVPVGSPVSFPKRSNPAWRLVAPSSPCRINTKSKHQGTPSPRPRFPQRGYRIKPTFNQKKSSQPSARSSGTTPSTSPSPFQDRGGREGGVVAATSRDTITQHI